MDGWVHAHTALFEPDDGMPPVFRSDAWRDRQLNSVLGAWAETRHTVAPYLKSAHTYLGCSAMTDEFHGFVDPYPAFFSRLSERVAALDSLLIRLEVYDRIAVHRAAVSAELDSLFGPATSTDAA